MADIVPKYHISLNSEQEMVLLECVRAGMSEYDVCWMLRFPPTRMVAHLKTNDDFRKHLEQAREEGKKIDKWSLYLTLIENGRKSRLALRLSGMAKKQIDDRRKADDAFDIACHEAEAHAHEALETEAYRRAMDGSDTMLIFMLKAGDPAKYRDTQRKVDEEKEPASDDRERHERAKRIAFALRLAAEGQAEADGSRDGQDPGQPALGGPAGPAN